MDRPWCGEEWATREMKIWILYLLTSNTILTCVINCRVILWKSPCKKLSNTSLNKIIIIIKMGDSWRDIPLRHPLSSRGSFLIHTLVFCRLQVQFERNTKTYVFPFGVSCIMAKSICVLYQRDPFSVSATPQIVVWHWHITGEERRKNNFIIIELSLCPRSGSGRSRKMWGGGSVWQMDEGGGGS